ncbi:hypothetical protein NC652_033004 [Populus alba x Populus x berolinensis]|nr:hypothetical protein NC652_033004 [Populus alba x Populus x berolinensis]
MIDQISSKSLRCDTKSTVEVFKSKIAINPCKISLLLYIAPRKRSWKVFFSR